MHQPPLPTTVKSSTSPASESRGYPIGLPGISPAITARVTLKNPAPDPWVMVIQFETDFARALPLGVYTAEGRLNTVKPGMYSARISFQIQWVR